MSAAPAAEPVEALRPSALLVGRRDGQSHRRIARVLAAADIPSHTSSWSGDRAALAAAGTAVVVVATGDGLDGIEAVRACRANSGLPVIAVMPAGTPKSLLRRALQAQASGIVLEDALESALVPTVRAVAVGQVAVPPALRRAIVARALSHREKEVLALVVDGLTNRQIADRLYLAESTVKTHLSSAFDKIDARSRAEAAAIVLDPDEGPALGVLGLANGRSASDAPFEGMT